jgi:hypothetical protein
MRASKPSSTGLPRFALTQVARRPSHQASRNSEPPPAAADGGSSYFGEL